MSVFAYCILFICCLTRCLSRCLSNCTGVYLLPRCSAGADMWGSCVTPCPQLLPVAAMSCVCVCLCCPADRPEQPFWTLQWTHVSFELLHDVELRQVLSAYTSVQLLHNGECQANAFSSTGGCLWCAYPVGCTQPIPHVAGVWTCMSLLYVSNVDDLKQHAPYQHAHTVCTWWAVSCRHSAHVCVVSAPECLLTFNRNCC